MATLKAAGGTEKLERIFAELEEKLPEMVLRPLAQKAAEQVALRAPTPAQELNTMMYGENEFAAVNNPGSDGRVRFYKPWENYLQNYLPTSFAINGLSIGIGDKIALNEISSYTYVNIGGKKNGSQEHEHIVTYPFWEAWEYGGRFDIAPRAYGGRNYPLLPAAGYPVRRMTKMIPGHFMFSGIDLIDIADHAFEANLKRIIPGVKIYVR